MERSLRNRLTFGPLMIAGAAVVLFLDDYLERHVRIDGAGVKGIGILALLLFILPLGAFELASLIANKQARPYRFIVNFSIALLLIHAFCTQWPKFEEVGASTLAFVVVGVVFFAAMRLALHRRIEDSIPVMAGTLLSTLYLGGLGWFLIALRVKTGQHTGFNGSTMTVVTILLTVKFTDIGAYFGGRALGRHKLIPWLSPGKTWEGLLCGLLTAGAVGALCSRFMPGLPWQKGLLFGVIIGGIGQMGDLLESMMKRDAQVKDSGSLIPGFGGVLDITDSPLLAAPFAYLLFSWA